ncbi:MAG: putative dipeptidyl peptidase [Ilumatobacteraceae bacterium]|nr:putative dipeptidyl peptidase [Ilumatobacteraceae bacterium]
MSDSFPRQYARTQRLTLGEPRNVVVSPDGRRVVFARSRAGDDPVNCLWMLDVESGDEHLVVDPVALLGAADDENLPQEERARRERVRETASGVTAFATDHAVTVVAFALSGRMFVAGLVSAQARGLAVDGPVFDPRPDPGATRVAYVSGRALRIGELDGTSWELAGDERAEISWGSAEFIAAEEMGRQRGYWWSPDGSAIAACRVDLSPVGTWYIGDPANPETPPNPVRYPAAGTDNADVTLHVLALDGGSTEVHWDRETFPYLAEVRWASPTRLLLTVQSRDQKRLEVLDADPRVGATSVVFSDEDTAWVELVPGTPGVLGDGRLVMVVDRDGARRLVVDDEAVTPTDLQVRSVLDTGEGTVTFVANPIGDATVHHVWRWSSDGLAQLSDADGVHSAAVGGDTVVLRSSVLESPGSSTAVIGGPTIASLGERPLVTPNVSLHRYAARELATAVLLPHDHDGSPLPVLLDPYGGPHAQRVLRSCNAYLSSQWFADQGFAVVVVDGRGTPGRGPEWEREVHLDLATAVLDDQVEALQAAAGEHPLDLGRVAIRGWSFGGYLAALAVMRRPDVFHAAIAGAPVTEWRLYDTHYTERYLGDPSIDAGPYAANSLLPLAAELGRPLLLIHGLADDNVVAAHSLQLSSALLADGKPHELLALVGVTHMTSQEVIAEHLLLHQLDFLRRSLPPPTARATHD